MKRSEQPTQQTPPARPLRLQAAGLYGEVIVLPPARAVPTPLREPKAFV
ncbi:hypothetical protein [Brevundimonas sp.]|nr:hypothetical protein [Brevundimonas sp.]HYC67375.1 hypothetical protein [Brevundimonas sp.]